jgi:formate dehydrogenase major subunit
VDAEPEPGLRIPNMFDAAQAGSFMGLYCEGEDIVQSDPNTQHVADSLMAMECIVVQDIFLNETAKYAHVFLPGSSFLEKDGTFTNAERRISRVRKVMPPQAKYADWEVTQLLSNALGYPMNYAPARDHGRDRRADAHLRRRELRKDRQTRQPAMAVQRRHRRTGTDIMHVEKFVRGKGRFIITKYVPATRRSRSVPAAADHRPHPVAVQRGRADAPHAEQPVAQRGPAGDPSARRRGPRHQGRRLGRHLEPRRRDGAARLVTERIQPGVVYTTFHFPESGANVITTDSSDWATNCPEYKVTAVQVMPVAQPSEWQESYSRFNAEQLELAEAASQPQAAAEAP